MKTDTNHQGNYSDSDISVHSGSIEKQPLKRGIAAGALSRAGLCILLAASTCFTGCVAHVGVGFRPYDPYYRDYHPWDDREAGFYNQWIVETHRDNRDYRKLKHSDQREYWNWRHNHHD